HRHHGVPGERSARRKGVVGRGGQGVADEGGGVPRGADGGLSGQGREPSRRLREGPGNHPLVFFDREGNVHAWQEKVREGWHAETVEEAQLVVTVGKNYRSVLETVYFDHGPPAMRVRYDLNIQVIAARTGELLAKKRFISLPREIKPGTYEDYGL